MSFLYQMHSQTLRMFVHISLEHFRDLWQREEQEFYNTKRRQILYRNTESYFIIYTNIFGMLA